MYTKNDLFMTAYNHLVKVGKVDNQKDFAIKLGVSQNTISRIKKHEVEVSHDTILALVNKFDGIFNMEYFKGRSVFLTIEDLNDFLLHPEHHDYCFDGDKELLEKRRLSMSEQKPEQHPSAFDNSMMLERSYAAAESYRDKLIANLEKQTSLMEIQLAEKDKSITFLESQVAEKDRQIQKQADIIADLLKTLKSVQPILPSSADEFIKKYPFEMGVAEGKDSPRTQV